MYIVLRYSKRLLQRLMTCTCTYVCMYVDTVCQETLHTEKKIQFLTLGAKLIAFISN